MITLQSLMLIALGFLMASLVFIALSTAYRNRVVRLTTEEIRRSVPITEAEIRADKDRLRAQYAIRVHKLESQSEQQRLSSARQRIEMNRRDARIAELDTEMGALRANLEENVNARRVLEHTVTYRLPRLEQQLDSARGLIQARDQEMASLKSETTKSVRALDEAMQINKHQRMELERTSPAKSRHAAVGWDGTGVGRTDGDMAALRSEVEALLAKTREQERLISRLNGAAGAKPGTPLSSMDAAESAEVEHLRGELAMARAQMEDLRAHVGADEADPATALAARDAMQSQLDEQAAELSRLRAGMAAYEEADEGAQRNGSGREPRNAGRARVNALQAQLTAQNETVLKLRSELAASNERLARQAAHYVEQLRRLGAGSVPTSVNTGRRREAEATRSLSSRISSPAGVSKDKPNGASNMIGGAGRGPTSSKVTEYIRSLTGGTSAAAAATAGDGTSSEASGEDVAEAAAAVSPANQSELEAVSASHQAGNAISSLVRAAGASAAVNGGADMAEHRSETASAKPKSRLLDRISGLGK